MQNYAFTAYWGTNFNYIFLPFPILLEKMMEDKTDTIVIAPLWTTQS
jgi:hypothetical protein